VAEEVSRKKTERPQRREMVCAFADLCGFALSVSVRETGSEQTQAAFSSNCSSSVEPFNAAVETWPPAMVCATASK